LNSLGWRLPAEVQSLNADAVPIAPQSAKQQKNRGKGRRNAVVRHGGSRRANGPERTKLSQRGEVLRVGGPKPARNPSTAKDL
jgi:hypothetical protein